MIAEHLWLSEKEEFRGTVKIYLSPNQDRGVSMSSGNIAFRDITVSGWELIEHVRRLEGVTNGYCFSNVLEIWINKETALGGGLEALFQELHNALFEIENQSSQIAEELRKYSTPTHEVRDRN